MAPLSKNYQARQQGTYRQIWPAVDKCVFCDLKEKYIITRYGGMVLTTNLYPYIDGHLMLIPEGHVTCLKELSAEQWEAVRILQYLTRKILKPLLGVRSLWLLYREGAVGKASAKTVDHLHIHLLPYRPELVEWHYQELRVSPQQLASTMQKHKESMDRLVKRFTKKYGASTSSK